MASEVAAPSTIIFEVPSAVTVDEAPPLASEAAPEIVPAGNVTVVDAGPTTTPTVLPVVVDSTSVSSPTWTSSSISTSFPIAVPVITDTTSLESTSSPISTSSSLQASTLPTSSTSVFSTTHPTSPTPPPSGPSASAKIGIGLGVPLGVIVLAIVAFLGYLYGKRRGNERNATPAADEQFHGFPGDKDPSAMQGQDGAGAVGPQLSDDNGELPRYAEELQGSPGVKRHELPAQREVTGYFSPDAVTK